MNPFRRWTSQRLPVHLCTMVCVTVASLGLAGCSPAELKSTLQSVRSGNATSSLANTSVPESDAGNATGTHQAGSTGTPGSEIGRAQSGKPASDYVSSASLPFGGATFDPGHLFDVYDDQVAVTQVGSTVYVAWESYAAGDMVYTSIAEDGHWVVTDRPVYSLQSLSGDGNWTSYLSGNGLVVVNRFKDNTFSVSWDSTGTAHKQDLYKGWVSAGFGVHTDSQFGVAVHLPYGAPVGGARYDLFLPSDMKHPKVLLVNQSQFVGANYAYDAADDRLIEARAVKGQGPQLDAWQLDVKGLAAHTQSSGNTNGTAAGSSNTSSGPPPNVQPVTDPSGKLLATSLQQEPDVLEVGANGTIYALTRDASQPDRVSVMAYGRSLKVSKQWSHIQVTNGYAQNVALTVSGSKPNVWDVYLYQGDAALQDIQLP